MTVLCQAFQFGCHVFLFHVCLLWLGLPVLCWITVVKADIPVLFLTLCLLASELKGNDFSVSPRSVLAVYVLHIGFIMLNYVPCIPTWLRIFIINGCWIWQMFFLHLLIKSYNFYPLFCLCSVLYLLMCGYGTNLISLDHGLWSFWCIAGLVLLVFHWGF